MSKILVIDDNLDTCMLLKSFLSRKDYEVDYATSGSDGLKKIIKQTPDVVLCDFRLPDRDGLEMIRAIKLKNPSIQVIIITGYGDVQLAVRAIKIGAFEYVTKPILPEEILVTIKQALNTPKSDDNVTKSTTQNKKGDTKKVTQVNHSIIKGTSEPSKQLHKLIDLVSPTDMTVMILGESGTGKEVTANLIHNNSKRSDKPFVAVDCGALPKEIAGSELFGHKKGAFTGALKDKKGYFELANGGTLFLDEIGNLTYDNQIKLLRVLQERKVRKLGDEKDIAVDVRVIVATNEELKKNVSEGNFREDLFYRLNEFKLELLPLRERKGDLKEFVEHFIESSNNELDKSIKGCSPAALKKFQTYGWPGNVRELKNVIKRAVLLSQDNVIKEQHLPQEILNPELMLSKKSLIEDMEITDLKSLVEEVERKAILKTLKRTSYNKTRCADILKVDRKTLYNKMKAYGLD